MDQRVERATAMSPIDPETVVGWGVDADANNDPTYPMRDRAQDDSPGMNWTRPPLQQPTVEVLRSIEHNRLPAAVGTSSPPKGLSGSVRRYAFRYSESQWAHWLLLILADRINVVEGLGEDLARGKLPNLLRETGLTRASRGDLNRTATLAIGAGAVVLAIVVAGALSRQKKRSW